MPKAHHLQFVKAAFREKSVWTAGELAALAMAHEALRVLGVSKLTLAILHEQVVEIRCRNWWR